MAELKAATAAAPPPHVRPFTATRGERLAGLMLVIVAAWAISRIDVSWARFVTGLGNAQRFIDRMLPPVFAPQQELVRGLVESLQIAVLATALGLALSLPLGLLAARNLMPTWVSWSARLVITVCRTFHPVIVAIVFVKAVGFGALAGILALTVASIGFVGKLFAEAIEEISMKPIEAVRAAGASFPNVLTFAVLPQVMYRFIGFIAYLGDSNLRNSAIVGLVGAGGIGGTLFAAFQRYDYDFVAGILGCIVALIMAGEGLQLLVKKVWRQ